MVQRLALCHNNSCELPSVSIQVSQFSIVNEEQYKEQNCVGVSQIPPFWLLYMPISSV